MKELTLEELNRLYTEADEADKEIFSEMRSNVLLICGDHYNRKLSRSQRLRGVEAQEYQKLRLTKNHLHKIFNHYVANILSFAPGVTILPQNETELQDQKDAELNLAVWRFVKDKHDLKDKVRQWARDYCGVGECAVKLFWDPSKGNIKGYEPKVLEDDRGPILDEMGQPMIAVDEAGNQIPDESKPVMTGDLVFERVFGFNLLRQPGCQSMADSEYLIYRKMVSVEHLKLKFAGDEEALKKIEESREESYVVFDSNKASYRKTNKETLVREFYWKPSLDYPEGYYAISTPSGILAEGPLPFGIYPIVWVGYDEYPTHPRGRSKIKQLRPFQAEINRASSEQAQTQITLGSDKVLYQAGTKLSTGARLPGVRGITFAGNMPPTILPGRDGSQYLPYIESNVRELYDVAELEEQGRELPAQVDAYAMLFASMRQLKKFAVYGEQFEEFLIKVCKTSLELARVYFPDDMVIGAVGRSEIINLSEFRKTSPLCYRIKAEAQNETVETQVGKQLTLNHVLQYVGPNLGKDDIGKIIRSMPFGNLEESFSDLTLDFDLVKNDFLALERGQLPEVFPYDNHDYIVKKTSSRMKKPDFKFLPPQVQQAYAVYMKKHEQALADQAAKLLAAKSEFIPTGGGLIAADYYIPNQDPSKSAKRVRLPQQSLNWLVKTLEAQGTSLESMEQMNPGALEQVAGLIPNHGSGQ